MAFISGKRHYEKKKEGKSFTISRYSYLALWYTMAKTYLRILLILFTEIPTIFVISYLYNLKNTLAIYIVERGR